MGEADGHAVGQHQRDLGVGHTRRLDDVLDRLAVVDGPGQRTLAIGDGHEVVQLAVEVYLAPTSGAHAAKLRQPARRTGGGPVGGTFSGAILVRDQGFCVSPRH